MIDAVRHHPEAALAEIAAPSVVDGEDRRRDAALRARPEDAIERLDESRMRELARDAEEIRQVELADPEHIDAGHRGDRLDVREPSSVSICTMTIVRSFSASIFATRSPPW